MPGSSHTGFLSLPHPQNTSDETMEIWVQVVFFLFLGCVSYDMGLQRAVQPMADITRDADSYGRHASHIRQGQLTLQSHSVHLDAKKKKKNCGSDRPPSSWREREKKKEKRCRCAVKVHRQKARHFTPMAGGDGSSSAMCQHMARRKSPL